jgi:acyl carrier protein
VVLKTSASRIDVHRPLGALGFDSLMGLELVRRLSASTGLKLPATAVFNYPTATALALEVARRMGVGAVAEPGPARESPSIPASMGAITDLSDEEAILALIAPQASNG